VYAKDALFGGLPVVVSAEAELDVSRIAVIDEGDAQTVLRDFEPVDDEINEGKHLTPVSLALRLGRRVENERNVDHRTATSYTRQSTITDVNDDDDVDNMSSLGSNL